jgi:hypothetical protein
MIRNEAKHNRSLEESSFHLLLHTRFRKEGFSDLNENTTELPRFRGAEALASARHKCEANRSSFYHLSPRADVHRSLRCRRLCEHF